MDYVSYSQAGQEEWVIDYLDGLKGGFFLDIGAMEGKVMSNTHALEKDFGWTGLLVECKPQWIEQLKNNRSSIVVPYAMYSHNGWMNFRYDREEIVKGYTNRGNPVPTITFPRLFEMHEVPEVIDYMSIDIEGSELAALSTFPFDKHRIKVITCEHNSYLYGLENRDGLRELLQSNGYIMIRKDVDCRDSGYQPFEDWWAHKDYVKSKQ